MKIDYQEYLFWRRQGFRAITALYIVRNGFWNAVIDICSEGEHDCVDLEEESEDTGRYESGHRVYRDGSYREDFRSDC
jgi:hypothetical protein